MEYLECIIAFTITSFILIVINIYFYRILIAYANKKFLIENN